MLNTALGHAYLKIILKFHGHVEMNIKKKPEAAISNIYSKTFSSEFYKVTVKYYYIRHTLRIRAN